MNEVVYTITSNEVNDLFIKIAQGIEWFGHINSPRGLKTKEVNDMWIELTNPINPVCTLPERSISLDYLEGEMDWYELGSLFVKDIAKHSSFWWKLADTNGTVNSNYGFLTKIEKFNGISQFEWCVERLKEDPNTRQAIMNYNQPKHKYSGVKDLVCTISQQFVVRRGKLDTIVLMRSEDFIYGFTYDIIWFTKLLVEMALLTKLPIGSYHHYAQSMHVYEKHFDMLEDMSRSNANWSP